MDSWLEKLHSFDEIEKIIIKFYNPMNTDGKTIGCFVVVFDTTVIIGLRKS